MIRPDLAAKAQAWIAELRLQDRVIAVRYVRDLCTPAGDPVYGLLVIENLDEGRFAVLIQDPDTWPVGGSRELSEAAIEEALVHELVHIRWIDLTADKRDVTSLVQEERATWATARALINAKGSVRAAMVRAMVSRSAATRRTMKGKAMAMDPETAKLLLDASESDDAAAMKQAIRKIVEDALTNGASGPPSGDGGMAADAGMGNTEMGDEKKKPPMGMLDEQQRYQRAMRSSLAEVERGAAIVREDAKRAIVRGMRADNISLTPHAEKQILGASTIEEAEKLATFARSMSAAPVQGATDQKKTAAPPTDRAALDGLTDYQKQRYMGYARNNPAKAADFAKHCRKTNAQRAGKVA